MIGTIFRIAWLRLWNNKQELLLTFVVPVMFFSIFAMIFTRGIGGTSAIKVVVVDDDRSSLTNSVFLQLRDETAIRLHDKVGRTNEKWSLERLSREIIRQYNSNVVIYFPKGFQSSLQTKTPASIQLLTEGSNPVEQQITTAILTQQLSRALAASHAATPIPPTATDGPLSPPIGTPASSVQSNDRAFTQPVSHTPPSTQTDRNPFRFESQDVFASSKSNPKVAMYASGIAVMFLLFSATGAGGSLLEENEAGTLDRLLTSELTLTKLLAGKWLFITVLGSVQLTVMFLWAQLVFGVDLFGHLPGFLAMTMATAGATASLALCLATMCKTRNQLNGVSVVLILAMSALGGSMIPRYIMSQQMQQYGRLTFNAWALDGYKKVFWYDQSVAAITDELTMLCFIAFALAIAARIFASRWAAR